MIKAFLSHTSADKDLVSLVFQKLSAQNAWYDAADIENGESIPEKINEGLRYATHYVLFWSERASKSMWVRAELNAAFVRSLEDKCKFLIFCLDDTKLPELLQPYKYDKVNKADLTLASDYIVDIVMAQDGADSVLSTFVNRTKEIGDIEEAARQNYKLIILNGILGIGKSSLAEKALQWLYPNRAASRIIIDFSSAPGMAELSLEMARKAKVDLAFNNSTDDGQKNNIRYCMEKISASHTLLVLKDIKPWLEEDGTINDSLRFITDLIVENEMFDGICVATSSRYVEIPDNYYEKTRQIPIKGMSDDFIAAIIRNNLPKSFQNDEQKDLEFAKRLYGYPLGAKLGAYRIANHGYDYYLQQPSKIQTLKVGLAKQLISCANISAECQEYLKIVALCRSRLRNEEYCQAFSKLKDNISKLADEAFFAGILRFDDDGRYKLEPLVEDYYYDLAFNSSYRKETCAALEEFLDQAIRRAANEDRLRLLPLIVHIYTLNGKTSEAFRICSELIATISTSMWDQYNHEEYDDALITAESILSVNEVNSEALYVKALCLIRLDDFEEAERILQNLLQSDPGRSARYYYAMGRSQERKNNHSEAIQYFEVSVRENPRYLSPHREMAKCYIHMGELDEAQKSIHRAKKLDDSNIFIIMLEAQLLQKQGEAKKAIEILSEQSLLEQRPAQILFRLGRAYDQLGDKNTAKQYYMQALEYNSKLYDARLCLLNHQIIDCPQDAEKEISTLKVKLRGKQRAILTNIEARYIGYIKQEESHALEILDGVLSKYHDRQWYAVRIQLLTNDACKHHARGRKILAQKSETELEKIKREFTEKFGDATVTDKDLLPDA